MRRFPESVLDKIRGIPTVEVAEYLGCPSGDWKPGNGGGQSNTCPIHGGRGRGNGGTPQFTAYPDGHWKCYSCDAGGGDGLALWAAVHGLDPKRDFHRVVEEMAGWRGIALPTHAHADGNGSNGSNGNRQPVAVKARPQVEPSFIVDLDSLPTFDMPKTATLRWGGKAPVAVYQVRRRDGGLLALHLRYETDGAKMQPWWRAGKFTLGEGLGTKDLPLYGVHQLDDLQPGEILMVHEGEKCADLGNSKGYRSVGTCTGASSSPIPERWADVAPYRLLLVADASGPCRAKNCHRRPSRKCVNCQGTGTDESGKRHMLENARNATLAGVAEIRILDWRDHGVSELGGDIEQFLDAGGGGSIQTLWAAAHQFIDGELWPELAGVSQLEALTAPTMGPVGLPEALERYLTQGAQGAGIDSGEIAVPFFVACGSLIGNWLGVRVSKSWVLWPNLWGIIRGKPGDNKSAGFALGVAPVNDLASDSDHKWEKAEAGLDALVDGAKAIVKGADDMMQKAGAEVAKGVRVSIAVEQEALRLAKERLKEAQQKRASACVEYVFTDINIPSVAEALCSPTGNPHGLLLATDELSSWFDALASSTRFHERAQWLETHPGSSTWKVRRLHHGRRRLVVPRVALSICGTVQTDRVAAMVEAEAGRQDGMMARFLYAVNSGAGIPDLDAPQDEALKDEVAGLCRRVWSAAREVPQGSIVEMEDQALADFRKWWRNNLERKNSISEEGAAGVYRAWVSKAPKAVASIALQLHLMDGHRPTERIGQNHVLTALDIYEDYLHPCARIALESSPQVAASGVEVHLSRGARRLKELIEAGGVDHEDNFSELTRSRYPGLGDPGQIIEAVEALRPMGWCKWERRREGKHRPRKILLHPDLRHGDGDVN